MTNISNLRWTFAVSAPLLALLGGCGGESDPWAAPLLPASETYQTLDSTEASTSTFAGVGLRSNNGNSNIEVAEATGILEHSTGRLRYGDSNYTLADGTGFSAGVASDAGGSLVERTDVYAGTYEYVMPVTFSYVAAGVAYTTTGFAGITTNAADVPVSGSATYNGDAVGSVVTTSDYFDLASGISTIVVNFGASEVDVTLNGFTATDALGAAATASLDTIQITGMTIAGNTFTGGTLETLLNSATVDITGTNTSTSSEGMFFGWDDAGAVPDEVAGVSVTVGDDGILQFFFVGD